MMAMLFAWRVNGEKICDGEGESLLSCVVLSEERKVMRVGESCT